MTAPTSSSSRRAAVSHRLVWRISVAVAAAMIGVSDRSIRRMIDTGDLPARKLPTGALSVRVADLDQVGEPIGPRTAARGGAAWAALGTT